MTTEEALIQLAASAAEAMVGVLEQLAPGRASHLEPRLAEDAATALANPPTPGLAASVNYVEGVSGGNVVLIGHAGARALAAAMMGSAPEGDPDAELTELELSAVSEAMSQMMASAAAETSKTLGYEVEIGTPASKPTGDPELAASFGDAAHVTVCDLRICEQPARFVQLVPHAFVVRMTKALQDHGGEAAGPVEVDDAARASLRASLSSTTMRVSAEIGRTRMPVDRLIGMPAGTIVELDREADDPIDVYVNGRRFAEGRLVLAEGDEWAVRIERILGPAAGANPSPSPSPSPRGDD